MTSLDLVFLMDWILSVFPDRYFNLFRSSFVIGSACAHWSVFYLDLDFWFGFSFGIRSFKFGFQDSFFIWLDLLL